MTSYLHLLKLVQRLSYAHHSQATSVSYTFLVADYQSSTSTVRWSAHTFHASKALLMATALQWRSYTWAYPGLCWGKFTGAQVKIMWKAKVKDKLLAYAISFIWTWSEHTGKTKTMVFVAKNILRSNVREIKKIFSWQEHAQVSLADACYVRTECAHAVPT